MAVRVPGEQVGECGDGNIYTNGTFVRDGKIFSSVLGRERRTKEADDKVIVEVVNGTAVGYRVAPMGGASVAAAPVVTCRLVELSVKLARGLITHVERAPVANPFRCLIRKEDVRATEKDRVEMVKCFRVGDVVLARLVGVTENQVYVLSTAENELGVVAAVSQSGHPMVPVSWTQMIAVETLV